MAAISSADLLLLATGNGALITFAVYMAGVMFLAWLSNRVLQSKSFLSEYFLGSRSLGVWGFALTFAATSASGGSFIGFPSLVYTHGWIVALWIGGYMIVPIVSMGLLAKRINQFGRITGAITIPELLRRRFESPALAGIATLLIVFFMVSNLVAQFKGGSLLLQTILSDATWFEDTSTATSAALQGIPWIGQASGGYLICLIFFAVSVIIYTTWGGFRAVVWTDVMQGVVMVGGVLVMLPLAIWACGGLEKATKTMAKMKPPVEVELHIRVAEPAPEQVTIPKASWLVTGSGDTRRVFQMKERAIIGESEQNAKNDGEAIIEAIELVSPEQLQAIEPSLSGEFEIEVVKSTPPVFGDDETRVYVTGPGVSADSGDGFLPLSLAASFFFMWTFSGAGQPGNMVRLLAFEGSNTLKRAIFTVSIYYTLIYFPLVVIFCCARVLLPGWEVNSDRIMPEMARELSEFIAAPWLAGILVAAPFAAVMSTMDSHLLMISSSLVRDVYQEFINPKASEVTIKRLTYTSTVIVGVVALLGAANPPKYLQDLIVFTGTGLSSSFLAPMALSLYWPRFNKQVAIVSMLGGFIALVVLYTIGYIIYGEMKPYLIGGFHPFIAGACLSLILGVATTLVTPPPPEKLTVKFFGEPK